MANGTIQPPFSNDPNTHAFFQNVQEEIAHRRGDLSDRGGRFVSVDMLRAAGVITDAQYEALLTMRGR